MNHRMATAAGIAILATVLTSFAPLTFAQQPAASVVAAKAGHNIQLEEPDLVLDSILDVVKQISKP